jgi:hypothetical protein
MDEDEDEELYRETDDEEDFYLGECPDDPADNVDMNTEDE